MKSSKTPSTRLAKGIPLTPEQRYLGEKNLARLMIIAHDEGVPAAMAEYRRMMAEIEATKAQSSPA